MSKVTKTVKKAKKTEPVVEPELNLLYKIKLQNMIAHTNSLKTIDIENDDLKANIQKVEELNQDLFYNESKFLCINTGMGSGKTY
jgi:hypothetical protein